LEGALAAKKRYCPFGTTQKGACLLRGKEVRGCKKRSCLEKKGKKEKVPFWKPSAFMKVGGQDITFPKKGGGGEAIWGGGEDFKLRTQY